LTDWAKRWGDVIVLRIKSQKHTSRRRITSIEYGVIFIESIMTKADTPTPGGGQSREYPSLGARNAQAL
jgi:hypothetical protein